MNLSKLTKREKFALVFLTLLLVFFILAQPILAGDYGLKETADKAFDKNIPFAGDNQVPVIIGKIVGAALAFIGVIFFVLIIWAGVTWMMARGNEQETVKAKELIYGAVIGLVIVLIAYSVTVYISGIFGQ